MDRLEERKAIAAKIKAGEEARKRVNENPEVIAAREAADAARVAHERAQREFNRVFHAHHRNTSEIIDEILIDFPDLLVERNFYTKILYCCAATGLPIFIGDQVRKFYDHSTEMTSFVLADLVTVSDGVDVPPITAAALPEEDADDEIEDEDDDKDDDESSEEVETEENAAAA